MRPQILITVCALLLAGCATQPLDTATGKPEVTISGRSADEIKSACINHFLNNGYTLADDSSFNLVFEKEAGVGVSLLFGSNYDPTTWMRIRLTIVQAGDTSHRVLARGYVVGNKGSGFERQTEMTGKNDADIQSHLVTIANSQ